MANLKKKYDRYGVAEWVTLGMGVLIFLIQLTRYTFNMLSDNTKLEIFVSVIWILLVVMPKALVGLIKRFGPSNTKE